MSRSITISGTDPTNPKCAEDMVRQLEHIRAGLNNMADEAEKLKHFADGIRTVLHYDQSYPDKRASMIASDVAATLGMLADALGGLADQTLRSVNAVTGCGVNMRGKFEWRPSR